MQSDIVGAEGLMSTLVLALQRKGDFVLQAKLASGQCAFAASQKHVMPLAEAGIVGTLIQVLVIILTTLTLEVFSVSFSVLRRIKNLELLLIYVPRSRLVEPPV